MEKMLTLFVIFFLVMVTVFLYGYLNDKKLGQLPPELTQIYSPTRLTPQNVRAAAKALSRNPVVMKNFLPPKTGRRYVVVGGVCSHSVVFTALSLLSTRQAF